MSNTNMNIIIPKQLEERLIFSDTLIDKVLTNPDAYEDVVFRSAWALFCLEKLLCEFLLVTEHDFPKEVPFGLRHKSQQPPFFDGLAEFFPSDVSKRLHKHCPHMLPHSRYWMSMGRLQFSQQRDTKSIQCAWQFDENPPLPFVEWTVVQSPPIKATTPDVTDLRGWRYSSEAATTGGILDKLQTQGADRFTVKVIRLARFLVNIDRYMDMVRGPYAAGLEWVFKPYVGDAIQVEDAGDLLTRAACWVVEKDNSGMPVSMGLTHPLYRFVEQFSTNLINSGKTSKELCPFYFTQLGEFDSKSSLMSTYTVSGANLGFPVKYIPKNYLEMLGRVLTDTVRLTGTSFSKAAYEDMVSEGESVF